MKKPHGRVVSLPWGSSCGSRIRTDDLEVMSLASYRAAPSRGDLCDLFCDQPTELSGNTSLLSRVTLGNVSCPIPLPTTDLSSNSQLNLKAKCRFDAQFVRIPAGKKFETWRFMQRRVDCRSGCSSRLRVIGHDLALKVLHYEMAEVSSSALST